MAVPETPAIRRHAAGEICLIRRLRPYVPSQVTGVKHPHRKDTNFRCINNLLSVAGLRVTRNHTLFNLGYRALLPLRRLIGAAGYEWATAFVGRLKYNGELVIHAKRLA